MRIRWVAPWVVAVLTAVPAMALDVYPGSATQVSTTNATGVDLGNTLLSDGLVATVTQTANSPPRGAYRIRFDFSTTTPFTTGNGIAFFHVLLNGDWAAGVGTARVVRYTTPTLTVSPAPADSPALLFTGGPKGITVFLLNLPKVTVINTIDINFQLSSFNGLAGDTLTIDAVHYPEPATCALFGLGLLGLLGHRMRRRRVLRLKA